MFPSESDIACLAWMQSTTLARHFKVLVNLKGFTGSDRFVGRPEAKLARRPAN
jgi:hypothetical protein